MLSLRLPLCVVKQFNNTTPYSATLVFFLNCTQTSPHEIINCAIISRIPIWDRCTIVVLLLLFLFFGGQFEVYSLKFALLNQCKLAGRRDAES